jgi:transcriptional regulator with XRE-family HTH domain
VISSHYQGTRNGDIRTVELGSAKGVGMARKLSPEAKDRLFQEFQAFQEWRATGSPEEAHAPSMNQREKERQVRVDAARRWLSDIMQERGINMVTLARIAGLTPPTISRVFSKDRRSLGVDAAKHVAAAFNRPEKEALWVAGATMSPPGEQKDSVLVRAITSVARDLPPEAQKELWEIGRVLQRLKNTNKESP